ncbi:hypothetical protein [Aquimarina brevivitae]|uniref:Uncharacterized protein n=1 Tax=Aquimarina brevivitae TaxID=323412 RepID=A0A4Q7P0Y6_9FLAO|nr:hypothetical protein [Aquimarina brevivitae]RZS93471.1 hypothetical protein EV197_2050 [Aquimarina brevivitae]
MKKLLPLILICLLFSYSCSDQIDEIDQNDKELLVKEVVIEFNKSAVKTGKYKAFIEEYAQKSAKKQLSDDEIRVLVGEFLGDQTESFLIVYHELLKLDLTPEEFYAIASQFRDMFNGVKNPNGTNSSSNSNSNSSCCQLSDEIEENSNGAGFVAGLIRLACGCGDPDNTEADTETQE